MPSSSGGSTTTSRISPVRSKVTHTIPGEREALYDDDVGLVDAARHLLRPAAQLRPDRRQHAGIAADAAENAADEADRRIGRAAAGAERVQARREQGIGAEGEQEHAEHHLQRAGVGVCEQMHADRNAGEAAER